MELIIGTIVLYVSVTVFRRYLLDSRDSSPPFD